MRSSDAIIESTSALIWLTEPAKIAGTINRPTRRTPGWLSSMRGRISMWMPRSAGS